MKSWLPRLRPIASTKRSSTRLFNIQRAISIWLLTLARRANDRCRRNGNRKICATHLLLTHAAESERPSAGFRDSHRAVAAATAPRVAVLSLGAEPVLSEAEGGHPWPLARLASIKKGKHGAPLAGAAPANGGRP